MSNPARPVFPGAVLEQLYLAQRKMAFLIDWSESPLRLDDEEAREVLWSIASDAYLAVQKVVESVEAGAVVTSGSHALSACRTLTHRSPGRCPRPRCGK